MVSAEYSRSVESAALQQVEKNPGLLDGLRLSSLTLFGQEGCLDWLQGGSPPCTSDPVFIFRTDEQGSPADPPAPFPG